MGVAGFWVYFKVEPIGFPDRVNVDERVGEGWKGPS